MTTSTQPIRVLVVDDSYFMRKLLTETLNDSKGLIQVVDSAANGVEAVAKCKKVDPDVLTMDVEMPEMDGLSALRLIMRDHPKPVVMLSSHTGQGTDVTIRALELGAVDCVLKPSSSPTPNLKSIQNELIEKIKLASRCKPKALSTEEAEALSRPAKEEGKKSEGSTKPARFVVAVASSTGGPKALQEFLANLPSKLPAGVVVVQHITVGFTKALARRLDEACSLKVVEAEDGQTVREGVVYIAPAGKHLVLESALDGYHCALKDDPPRLGLKPSADVMMQSVAKVVGKNAMGVILTGMGKDGVLGLKAMHQAGSKILAQDEESCVVYGMPKAAVEAGIVHFQLPLAPLADKTVRIVGENRKAF